MSGPVENAAVDRIVARENGSLRIHDPKTGARSTSSIGRTGSHVRSEAETCRECTQHALIAWRDFNVSGSEIVRHSDLVLRGQLDLAWLTFANTWLPVVTFSLASFWVLCGLALMIPPLLGKAKAARVTTAVLMTMMGACVLDAKTRARVKNRFFAIAFENQPLAQACRLESRKTSSAQPQERVKPEPPWP